MNLFIYYSTNLICVRLLMLILFAGWFSYTLTIKNKKINPDQTYY